MPTAHFIAFKTNFTNLIGTREIRTYPFNRITAKFMNELNEGIKPVLEKYIKIYEDEIKKCLDQ